jgi:hypothetical protein
MSDKRAHLAAELEAELPHFTGTEEYHRIVYPWLRNTDFLLTDGAKHLADKAGVIGGTAYWLIDLIASYQREKPVKDEPFQVWKLTVKDTVGKVTCDDGNGRILASQDIPFADFALDEVTLYVTSDDFSGIVVMLTSEY